MDHVVHTPTPSLRKGLRPYEMCLPLTHAPTWIAQQPSDICWLFDVPITFKGHRKLQLIFFCIPALKSNCHATLWFDIPFFAVRFDQRFFVHNHTAMWTVHKFNVFWHELHIRHKISHRCKNNAYEKYRVLFFSYLEGMLSLQWKPIMAYKSY